MMDMTPKHDRPSYHGGDDLYIRSVPSTDLKAWLQDQFTNGGFEVPGSEPVLRILPPAEDVPYNVQMLAHKATVETASIQGRHVDLSLGKFQILHWQPTTHFGFMLHLLEIVAEIDGVDVEIEAVD